LVCGDVDARTAEETEAAAAAAQIMREIPRTFPDTFILPASP
jgi:hypothetical protein